MQVSLSEPVPCPPEQVRAALFREEVWTRFLDGGKAVKRTLALDEAAGTVAVTWANALSGSIPAPIRKAVGDEVDVAVRLHLAHGEPWRLDIDGVGGRATLRSAFRVEPDGTGSTVHVDGPFELKGGPLNLYGRFESQAWNELVRKIVVDDLLPELCR